VFAAAAAHGVKVMLDGQGADEQLAGYHAFFRVDLLELLRRGRLLRAHETAHARRRQHEYGVLRQLADAGAAALPPRTLAMLRRKGLVDEVVDLDALSPSWSDPFGAMTGRRRGVRAFSIDLLGAGSLPMLLHWEDRNAMAHGIEARVPFLCPALVQLVLGLPSSAKLDGAQTKVVLRKAMAGRVPERIRLRTDKLAFETPDRRWLCETHRDAAREALAGATRACGPLLRPRASRALEAVIAGERPYDAALWRVICFGAWLRRFGVRV
jgi:asparagine synthase (glutamine-hydrolysing)